jgi:hypothetical protein
MKGRKGEDVIPRRLPAGDSDDACAGCKAAAAAIFIVVAPQTEETGD